MLKNVKYQMGADPAGKLSRTFGVYDEESGLSQRGAFIINPEGVVVSSEVNHMDVGRNAEELLRKLQANIYKSGHPEEVCPANWHPGEKTMKPAPEFVGKAGGAYVQEEALRH
jgi:peroxiredoxin (alkyl hydroperoxide reductase subunit C)